MILKWWHDLRKGLQEAQRLKLVEQQAIQELQEDIMSGRCYPQVACESLDQITINVKKKDTDKLKEKRA